MFRIVSAAVLVLLGTAFVGAEETPAVKEGDKVPDVKLEATQIEKALPKSKDEKTLSLSDLKGKNIVLFFYPKAMTKGCTIESCGFSAKAADFAKLDTIVIGISTDKLDDQAKFTEKEKLEIPLLADPDKKLTKAFGAFNPDRGMASRYTYVIDKKGVIRKIYTKVAPADHPGEVLEYVKENLKEDK
jgi:thioredoxin-dependent peroxiredoxin